MAAPAFSDIHDMGPMIGEGSFGKVYCLKLKPGVANPYTVPVEKLCVKVILDKTKGGHKSVDLNSEVARRMLEREYAGPDAVVHPNIVRVHKVYKYHNVAGQLERVDVVISLVEGAGDGALIGPIIGQLGLTGKPTAFLNAELGKALGGGPELFRYIVTRDFLNETQVRFTMYQLLAALHAMHTARPRPIMHRDLKCENVLVARDVPTKAGPVPFIQIADFGHARAVPMRVLESEDLGLVTNGPVDSGQYVAPELRTDRYDTSVDIFSAGVILYVLYTKTYPFSNQEEDARGQMQPGAGQGSAWLKMLTRTRAVKGEWFKDRISEGGARPMSAEGRDLLAWMLAPRPEVRFSAEQCMAHPWFSSIREETAAVFGDGVLLDYARKS